jgi:hypothetical protein
VCCPKSMHAEQRWVNIAPVPQVELPLLLAVPAWL